MRFCRPTGRFLSFWLTALVLVARCSQETPQTATTVGGFVPDTKPALAVRSVDATLPAGTKIHLTLLTPLSVGSNRVGDLFSTRVTEGVKAGALLAIPEGSLIQGDVRNVTPAKPGAGGAAGKLTLSFKVVNTVTGAGAPLSARLSGEAGETAAESFTTLREGTPMTIVLEEPLTIKVNQ